MKNFLLFIFIIILLSCEESSVNSNSSESIDNTGTYRIVKTNVLDCEIVSGSESSISGDIEIIEDSIYLVVYPDSICYYWDYINKILHYRTDVALNGNEISFKNLKQIDSLDTYDLYQGYFTTSGDTLLFCINYLYKYSNDYHGKKCISYCIKTDVNIPKDTWKDIELDTSHADWAEFYF